ncbi:serine/threonine protein kinase, partial [Mycobacterium paraffinicum]
QPFTGTPAWNQPPPKRRNPWPLIAGVAALVVVLVVAAVGIAMVMGGDDSNPQANRTSTTTTTTTSRTVTTTTTTRASNPQSKLLSVLPAGYPNGACTPATPKANSIWVNALAMVDCDQNTNQGGPSRAVYGLFANADLLKKAFNDDVAAVQLLNCPGAGPSPDGWHHDSTPTVTAGSIACGTYKNHPNIIWTNDAKLLLCDVYGDPPSLEDLHTWWTNYGG